MNNLTKLALATALLGNAGMAQAQLNSSSAASSFSGTASVTATGAGVKSATNLNDNAAIATVGVGQFDSATGVLVGADILLNSGRNQSIAGVGNKNNGPGRTANGSGSSTAEFSAPGASGAFTSAALSGGGCSLAMGPTGAISCSWGATNSAPIATNGSSSVSSASLNSYVGTGTTDVALSLPSLQATTTLSSIAGMSGSGSSSTYSVSWAGNLQASYSYLFHSAASFDSSSSIGSLTLDFGTVAQGSSVSPLAFSLFNLASTNRAGLDLDSVSGSGDTSKLTTNLATFVDLAQGGSNAYSAWLDTSSVGNFSTHYMITLSDADIGASATRSVHQLELNLVGNVAAVPEPESYAMLTAGLGLIGFIARRRRGQSKLNR